MLEATGIEAAYGAQARQAGSGHPWKVFDP